MMKDDVLNCNQIHNKQILFITTKNIDYIRNNQELELLKKLGNRIDIIDSKYNLYICKIVQIYFKLLLRRLKPYDIVFIGFAPQLILPFWKWKFSSKYIIIDFFISLYDTLVFDRKKIDGKSLMAKLILYFDKTTLQYANHVIADTKVHGEYFSKELGLNKNKLEILYLEVDSSIYYFVPLNKSKHLEERFVVLYFGSVLPLQGVDIILDAISELKYDDRFYFQIIGPINKKYEKPISKNIEYIVWLQQEDLACYIANADLCLAGHFAKNIEKAKRTIPGKAYIYEKMEKKMILGDCVANHELFNEDDKHCFVEMGNSQELMQCILRAQEQFEKIGKKILL